MKLQQFFLFVLTFIFLSCTKEEIKVFQEDLPDDACSCLISVISEDYNEAMVKVESRYYSIFNFSHITLYWGTSHDELNASCSYYMYNGWVNQIGNSYIMETRVGLPEGRYYFKAIAVYEDPYFNEEISIMESDVASCNVQSAPEPDYNGREWVDLGLPSGLKWATCNIGASSPEEPGDYFAWGEIEPKSEYFEKNCITLGKEFDDISGNSSHDAARANWGGTWRMPTRSEFSELHSECTWTWTTQDGRNGYKVESKKNGNSIFLPAAGFRYGSAYHHYNDYGCYWASDAPSSVINDSYSLYFYSSDAYDLNARYRYDGQSVRAVSE